MGSILGAGGGGSNFSSRRPGLKWPGGETDYLPSSAEVTNIGPIPLLYMRLFGVGNFALAPTRNHDDPSVSFSGTYPLQMAERRQITYAMQ